MPFPRESARQDFLDWRTEFQLYPTHLEGELSRQINLRCLGAELTAAQQAALDALQPSEQSNLRQMFSCLGSESFRWFKMKSGWDAIALVAANTLAAALAICDDIFCGRPHPVLAWAKLYKRLVDQEDLRIMEVILTNCNDRDLLEKMLAAYSDPPRLNDLNDPLGGGPSLSAEDPITFPERGEMTIQEQADLFNPSPAMKRGSFATLTFNAG